MSSMFEYEQAVNRVHNEYMERVQGAHSDMLIQLEMLRKDFTGVMDREDMAGNMAAPTPETRKY
jgi:hypothetical protein